MGRKRKRNTPEIQVNFHYEDGSTEVDVCDLSNVSEGDNNIHNVNETPSLQIPEIGDTDSSVSAEVADNEEVNSNISTNSENQILSSYYIKVKRKHTAWEKLRDEAIKTTFKVNGMFYGGKCILCGDTGLCRCKDCGPFVKYCEECAQQVHTEVNVFHRVEILKNGIFFPLELHRKLLSRCSCDSIRHCQSIVVMDLSGASFEVEIEFCKCQPNFIQLIQFGLWGATPSKPTLAFSIELLELFHAIQMECQVSLKSICQAYKMFSMSWIASISREIYPVILDSFEEYRLYRHKLDTLTCILPDLDEGNVCPACPKDDGSVFESFDALFIVRRKNAGQSMNDPLFGSLMFYPQKDVDNFVTNYYLRNQQSRNDEGCHHFLAGDAVRSRHRYKALSETAVFGRGCRHEFPKKFLSLKHGERLAYAIWMVEDLQKTLLEKPNLEIKVLYDISCMLVKHLQSRGDNELLETVEFAIPIFHCYGHEGHCQVNYNPRRKDGFGLTDGEMLERLWSYLRPFGKMTKEMRPSHRTDVLTDALLHYGKQTLRKLGLMLVNRMEKAIKMEEEANRDLDSLLESLTVPIGKDAVVEWTAEELQYMQKETQIEEVSWDQKYVIYLQIYFDVNERWQRCTDPSLLTTYCNQMQRIDKLLQDIEKEHGISARWISEDEQFLVGKEKIASNKEKRCLQNLRKHVVERWFMLSLKSKYFEGQAIANRLAKQITRLTKRVKKTIEAYNKIEHGQSSYPQHQISLEEIKDPDCPFWSCIGSECAGESDVPFALKRKAIDLQFMTRRCVEEKALVEDDMKNTYKYFTQQRTILHDFIFDDSSADDEAYEESGAKHFARLKLLSAELTMSDLIEKFNPYIDVSLPQFKLLNEERAKAAWSDTDIVESEDQVEDQVEDEVFSINEAMVVNDIIDETDSEAEESDVDELYEEGIISDSVSSVFN